MQKTLVFTAMEALLSQWIRLEGVLTCLDELSLNAPSGYDPQKYYRQRLRQQVQQGQKQAYQSCKRFYQEMSQGALSAESPSSSLYEPFFNQSASASVAQLKRLSHQLRDVHHNQVLPEVGFFLKETIAPGLFPLVATLSVLYENTGASDWELLLRGHHSMSSGTLLPGLEPDPVGMVLRLPIHQANNPKAWPLLMDDFAQMYLKDLSVSDRQLATNKASQAVFAAGLALRLAGPAYYFHRVTQALLTHDVTFMVHIEPFLFYGLNHLNFSDKGLILLHEGCEKYRQFLAVDQHLKQLTPEWSNGASLTEATMAQWLRWIEQFIPDKFAFSAKAFQRSVSLQGRLQEGVLLSASTLYPKAETYERLVQAQHLDDAQSVNIYEHLRYVTETPNTPREIINAGWLYALQQQAFNLADAFELDDEDGLLDLKESLMRQDALLLKSIEASEVHRLLYQQPVAVNV